MVHPFLSQQLHIRQLGKMSVVMLGHWTVEVLPAEVNLDPDTHMVAPYIEPSSRGSHAELPCSMVLGQATV